VMECVAKNGCRLPAHCEFFWFRAYMVLGPLVLGRAPVWPWGVLRVPWSPLGGPTRDGVAGA